jgi:cytochrome c5
VKRAATALALTLAAACGGAQPRPAGETQQPGAASASEGHRLYLAKCTHCHAAYAPSAHTPQQWSTKIDEMERNKRVHLTPEERSLILAYLSGR